MVSWRDDNLVGEFHPFQKGPVGGANLVIAFMVTASHARGRRQPPGQIAGFHAPAQLGIETRDLLGQPGNMEQNQAGEIAHCCRQRTVIAVDDGRGGQAKDQPIRKPAASRARDG